MQNLIKKTLFQNEKFNLLFIAAFAVMMILPVLFWGVPDGFDFPHHYQTTATFLDSIRAGEFYPSWSLDRNLGYGGLELRMYPPVSHYVLALVKLAVNDWHLATWIVYSFWCVLGCSGIYFLAREFVKAESAVFAAVLFAVIPYRINEVYQTFLYAEFAAGSILPFCFAFLTRIIKAGNEETKDQSHKRKFFSGDLLGLTVSLAALVLTHLPLTLIGVIALGIYFLCQVRWKFSAFAYSFAGAVFAGVLSLSATSFFWVKVLQERFMMAKTSVYEEVHVHYEFNFLLTPLQTYDQASHAVSFVAAFYDLVLLLTVLIVLPMAIVGLLKNDYLKTNLRRGLLIVFAFSVFITTILSKPLWDNLPLLFEVQFPWRWLNIVSVFAPVLAAGGFSVCLKWYKDERFKSYSVLVFGVILINLILSLSWAVSTARYVAPEKVEKQVETAIKKEGFNFWWTIWARKEFINSSPEKVFAQNRQIEIVEWKNTSREFVIEAGQTAEARIAVFYHPNWHIFINNNPVEIRPDPSGAVAFEVPPEKSRISMEFVETKEVLSAKNISLAAWVFIFLFAAFVFAGKPESEIK